MVSKASEDFPEPLSPVMTVRLFRGISTSILRRLCWRAPCTEIRFSIWGGRGENPIFAAFRLQRQTPDFIEVAGPRADSGCVGPDSGIPWEHSECRIAKNV